MKDELAELLKDEPLDKLDTTLEEDCHQALLTDPTLARVSSKGKMAWPKRWWKQVTTSRKKAPISPIIPIHSTSLCFDEMHLIESLILYSYNLVSGGHERIRFHEPS